MDQREEDIIKDLLFEHSTRRVLQKSTQKSKPSFNWMKVAAVIATIIAAYFVFTLFLKTDDLSRAEYAAKVYESPVYTKARGTTPDLIDSHFQLYESKQYDQLLKNLQEASTERDLFYKANLEYKLSKLDAAESTIQSTTWTDEIYQEETNLLLFIIGYQNEYDRAKLQQLFDNLSNEDQAKVAHMMD